MIKSLLILLTIIPTSYGICAGLFSEKTRVIYPSDRRSESIQIFNENTYPVLVQVWVDNGELALSQQKVKLPVIAVPPLLRLQGKESRSIRLMRTETATLPEDRESIFWLNYQMIPPAPPERNFRPDNTIDLSVRTRQKIFFRPSTLEKEAIGWPERVKCYVKTFIPGKEVATCKNPTPFYATIDKVELLHGQRKISGEGGMISPFSERDLSMKKISVNDTQATSGFSYNIIDDYGFVIEFKR